VQKPRLIPPQIHDRLTPCTVLRTPIANKVRADSHDEINRELVVGHEGTIWTCQWVPGGDTRSKRKTHRYPAGWPPATEKR
jgi:hypothetical protein